MTHPRSDASDPVWRGTAFAPGQALLLWGWVVATSAALTACLVKGRPWWAVALFAMATCGSLLIALGARQRVVVSPGGLVAESRWGRVCSVDLDRMQSFELRRRSGLVDFVTLGGASRQARVNSRGRVVVGSAVGAQALLSGGAELEQLGPALDRASRVPAPQVAPGRPGELTLRQGVDMRLMTLITVCLGVGIAVLAIVTDHLNWLWVSAGLVLYGLALQATSKQVATVDASGLRIRGGVRNRHHPWSALVSSSVRWRATPDGDGFEWWVAVPMGRMTSLTAWSVDAEQAATVQANVASQRPDLVAQWDNGAWRP